MGGNYTAGSAALRGVAYVPEVSDQGAVEIGLNENAERVWAVEMANLHQAAQDLAQPRWAPQLISSLSSTKHILGLWQSFEQSEFEHSHIAHD